MRGFPLGVEFTAESVAAMLAGLKTQTRRAAVSESGRANPLCKLEPGDQVYVREPISWHPGLAEPVYDGAPFYLENEAVNLGRKPENWEPRGDRTRARFMPKWAGRLIATVRSVRIEPVRAITDEDALAEGIVNAFFVNGWMDAVERHAPCLDTERGDYYAPYGLFTDRCGAQRHAHVDLRRQSPARAYAALWNQLHRKPGRRFADNPDVVVVDFAGGIERGCVADLVEAEG